MLGFPRLGAIYQPLFWSAALLLLVGSTTVSFAQLVIGGDRGERPMDGPRGGGTREREREGVGLGIGIGIEIGKAVVDQAAKDNAKGKSGAGPATVTKSPDAKKPKGAAKKGDDAPVPVHPPAPAGKPPTTNADNPAPPNPPAEGSGHPGTFTEDTPKVPAGPGKPDGNPTDPTDTPVPKGGPTAPPATADLNECCSCAKSMFLKLESLSIYLPPSKKRKKDNQDADFEDPGDEVTPSHKVNAANFNVEIHFENKKSQSPGKATLIWEENISRLNPFYRLAGITENKPTDLVTALAESTKPFPGKPGRTIGQFIREDAGDTATLTHWYKEYVNKSYKACPKSSVVVLEDKPWAASPRRLYFRIRVDNPANCGCVPLSLELKAAQILWPLKPGNTAAYPAGGSYDTWNGDASKFYGPGGEMKSGDKIDAIAPPARDAAVPDQPPKALR